MRCKGKLKTWNDDRGFGFIAPIQGGEEVFVHIKAFSPSSSRPQVNELLWFEIDFGPGGKKRAKNVEFVRKVDNRRKRQLGPSAQRNIGSLFAIPGFVVLYIVVGRVWQPPVLLAAIYLAASAVTYYVYAKDKAAAQRSEWRTAEARLHLLALAGGWPGALLAQQFLRHKSTKPAFRAWFWTTVILNVVAFVLFCSPAGQTLWAPFLTKSFAKEFLR